MAQSAGQTEDSWLGVSLSSQSFARHVQDPRFNLHHKEKKQNQRNTSRILPHYHDGSPNGYPPWYLYKLNSAGRLCTPGHSGWHFGEDILLPPWAPAVIRLHILNKRILENESGDGVV